ncbi:RyR domain-containing protein [Ensifer aridi]|uniref:RyR domain-containing protein n=1 Tax=Ensifer aridi TaxID=1708715 RepID=UPI000A11C59D|nr:RyR domain-containing protein [Ensifer aridi]
MNDESIARICHEANRAYCAALGDHSQPAWDDAPEWQRKSAVTGVQFIRSNPDAPPSASHDSWLAEKERDGWKHGPVKDADKKEHPCFVPYDALPIEQKAKDYIFGAIVRASIDSKVEVGGPRLAALEAIVEILDLGELSYAQQITRIKEHPLIAWMRKDEGRVPFADMMDARRYPLQKGA